MATQQTNSMFNAASLDASADYLPQLKIDVGSSVLVSFLKTVPGMPEPPFVYCKVHWNSEMGDNGRLYQCFGGACCEQVTWQKGWADEPGKFAAHKARKRYYIPVVHYEQDPTNPAVTKATVKYIDMTFTAYSALCTTLKNTNEGLGFFDRDILLSVQKVNGATSYIYDKRESTAQWKSNALFKQQVEEQLPTVAQRLLNAMPAVMTESEFMQMKPELDKKVNAAMQSRQQIDAAQPGQTGFNQLPGVAPQDMAVSAASVISGQPVQQFTQPQVNIPVTTPVQQPNVQTVPPVAQPTVQEQLVQAQPQAQPVTTAEQAQVPQTPAPAVADTVPEAQPFEVPKVELSFDPNSLLK